MKPKKKLTALILAALFGPFWFYYIRKPKKAWLYFLAFGVPVVNIIIYYMLIRNSGKEVVKYNTEQAKKNNQRCCKKCGDINSNECAFCTSCGFSLYWKCRSCLVQNYSSNKFCHACGDKITLPNVRFLTLKNFMAKS